MYNLRQEIFEETTGKKDDIHYLPLTELKRLIELAGGKITMAKTLSIGLPHFLAFIPKEYVEKVSDEKKRKKLLSQWDVAFKELQRYGEEHPPTAILKFEA